MTTERPTGTSTTEQIDALLDAAVAEGVAPGVAAVSGSASGVSYRGASGSRGAGPLTPDSVLWIASMTKLVTVIAVLQQVERGALSLDAPITDVLPQLADKQVLDGFDDDGAERLRPAVGDITLRQLLVHTAGFAYDFFNADIAAYQARHGVPGVVACQHVTLGNPLVADPGTVWEYGPNLEWAGLAVEKVTGVDLERYFSEQIFTPLGLTGSGFVIGERRDRLATMNTRLPDGTHAPIEVEIPQEPEFYMGGGGLYSTPEDFLTVLRLLLAGGTLDGVTILGHETIAAARDNQIGDLEVGVIPSADPGTTYEVDLLPGTATKWSLFGLLNVEQTPFGRSAGSLMWAGLSNCYFWVDWEQDTCGALFTQMLPFADPRILAVFEEFEIAAAHL